MDKLTLGTRNVSIEFPGVKALTDVNFEVSTGEIRALVGANGAGKSTLMKVFAGANPDYTGEVYLNDKVVELRTPMAAKKLGIQIVYQEVDMALVPTLSVAENVMLNDMVMSAKGKRLMNWAQLRTDAKRVLEKLHIDVNVRTLVQDLSLAQKQMVLIARAIANECNFLILDEPTAPLSDTETAELFRLVKHLQETENIAIIFISHRFEDMYRLASRVTVFRDSQYIGTYDVDGITNADLIKAMVGREIKDLFPKPEVKLGDEMLKVENLSRTGYFKDVSFSVRAGEILGLTGLVGAGRTETVEAVCGITQPDSGKVYLEGKEVHIKKPSDAMEKGIILLPEDRQKEGLIMSWGLGRNVTLPTISKYAKNGINDEKTERDLAKKLLEEVDTKAVDIFQPASSLSGGNQQKVVVAKALSQEMKVVIMDEPTKGVDVGAKAEIYAIMGDLAKKGYAIILISSEMPEILGMADRIVVMCNGRKTGELNRGEATQERILELAMEKGHTGGAE